MGTKCHLPYHFFSRRFYILGGCISRNTAWFLVIPTFVTLLLSTGLQRAREILDVEYFVSIDNSEGIRNRGILEKLFPMDISSDFDLGRFTRLGSFGSIIAISKNGSSALKKSTFKEIQSLDEIVKNITIHTEKGRLKYQDLCVKNGGSCFAQDILSSDRSSNSSDHYILPYPIDFNDKNSFKFYGATFGGVKVDHRGLTESVKAIRLFYYLDFKKHKNDVYLWEKEFLRIVNTLTLPSYDLFCISSKSIENELHSIPLKAIPYFCISAIFVVLFTVSTCIVPDSIQGKPWIGIMTSVSSFLASLSGFGIAFYLGVPYIFYNAIIPFLILGVSMDDTFVLLSAWRHTDHKKNIEDRLSQAYSISSVAITITSFTNIIAFSIGLLISPYNSVRIFCIFTTFCLIFDYVYQITFVGAFMALCGHAEKNNRHCFTFLPVNFLEENNELRGILQKSLYYSGHIRFKTKATKNSFLIEIWAKLGEILSRKVSKVVVIVFFIVYFFFGLWNALKLTNNLETGDLTFYNSPTNKYYIQHHKYFVQYLVRVHVFIDTPINYADPKVNETLHNMFQEFESSPFLCNTSLTESWLRSFHRFLNHDSLRHLLSSYNVTNKSDFILLLRRLFLRHPLTKRFSKDIVFNENRTEIVASRFLFQTNYTKNDNIFNEMWWEFFNLVKNQSLPVKVFNRYGIYFDGFKQVIPATLQTVASSSIVVAFICFVFFLSFICTACVAICIISITVGVLGYMHLWGVSLNIVTMTIIIIVSGFSVDYSSHIACAYISSSKSSKQRLIGAISEVGFPIFQAGMTSILCIIPFVVPICYTFEIMMKVIILVCFFAMLHSMIFLPVFLSLAEDIYLRIKRIFQRRTLTLSNISANSYENYAVESKDLTVCSIRNNKINSANSTVS